MEFWQARYIAVVWILYPMWSAHISKSFLFWTIDHVQANYRVFNLDFTFIVIAYFQKQKHQKNTVSLTWTLKFVHVLKVANKKHLLVWSSSHNRPVALKEGMAACMLCPLGEPLALTPGEVVVMLRGHGSWYPFNWICWTLNEADFFGGFCGWVPFFSFFWDS